MMTPRQNALETIHYRSPEYVPASHECFQYVGLIGPDFALDSNGKDWFGVPWIKQPAGNIVAPGFVLFDDIADWEKKIVWPDLDMVDFKAFAEKEEKLFGFDRENKLLLLMSGNMIWMHLTAFMGMENAMIAMMEDPEECMNFFEKLTEWKEKYIRKMIDAYNPDIFSIGDDIATARDLFFSPETYREMYKPYHKRIVEEVKRHDRLMQIHTCGKCEAIIPDYVEIGADMLQSTQAQNDVAGILDRFAGKLAIEGGWNATRENTFLADEDDGEVLRLEVQRCLSQYKKKGYIMMANIYTPRGNARVVGDSRWKIIEDEYNKLRWF